MDISERIRFYRKEKGLTQVDLGKLVHKSSQVISNWERGYTTTINQDDIINLSKALSISVDKLVDENSSLYAHEKSSPLPPLTSKDERNIQKKLDDIMNDLSPDSGFAYYNGDAPMTDEDKELLRISMENTLRLARQMAKQKFTPKKYRKNEPAADTATLIGKKILTASTDAQLAVSAIIEQDKKK